MAPLIRSLGPEDIADVHSVWRRAGLHFRPDGRDSAAHLTAELEQGTAFLVGAVEGGDLVGVALGTDDGRKGWINRLAVLADHRRTGVARALIAECEQEFGRRGIGIVASLVEESNEAGLDLFRSAGFTSHDIAYFRKPSAESER